ncbi:MAG: phosphate ABC transporter substrate-binding protein PstS [Acidobacteriota bacterium]
MNVRVNRRPGAGVPVAPAILLGLVVLVLSRCSAGTVPRKEGARGPAAAVPAGGVLLRGAGATFPSMLYEKWFSVYHSVHPNQVIAYAPVGSGEGVRRFVGQHVDAEERVDFGASDAAMRDDEIAAVREGAILVPVTAGSVALAYNLPDLPANLRLSRQAYVGIFTGEIRNWSDPRIAKTNPGVKLPNLTIATVVRQDGSGTTFAFTKHLDAISDSWRTRYGAATLVNWPGNSMRASGNEGVAARIKASLGSVGYVGSEFARRAGLRAALLENQAGKFVAPSEHSASEAFAQAELPENMRLYVPDPAAANAYPVVTLTWILLYRNYPDSPTSQALHELFRWCLTDGQQYASELGYAPLPPNIVQRSLAALDALR